MIGENFVFREKQNELSRLKEEFLALFKRQEDIFKENFVIYNRYNLLFGEKYFERYLLFCEGERLRRKIELYQSYINRGEEIDKGFVEAVLNAEFREYEERLEKILEEYRAAQEFEKLPLLTKEEAREVKRIYLKIAKRIHPDLNSDFNEEMKELWLKTLNAYKLNDLETLQECEVLLDSFILPSPPVAFEKLDAEIENFKKKIRKLQRKNRKLEKSFPYNQKELLTDSEWVNDKLEDLDRDIELLKKSLEFLKERLQEIDPTYEKEIS